MVDLPMGHQPCSFIDGLGGLGFGWLTSGYAKICDFGLAKFALGRAHTFCMDAQGMGDEILYSTTLR